MLSVHPAVSLVASLAATLPSLTATSILTSILFSALPIIVPHLSIFMSSDVHNTAVVSPVPIFLIASSPVPSSTSFPSTSAVRSIYSAPAHICWSSPEPVAIPQPTSKPEHAASSTTSRKPVIALLQECLARDDAEFAELHEAFIARKDCFLKLESPLSSTSLTESTLCSQDATLQIDFAIVLANFINMCS